MSAAPDAARPPDTETTDDLFLGDRLRILQPVSGFRAGLDSVILAASLNARAGETLFEPGAGVGVASLCAAARMREAQIVGLEINPTYGALARQNSARNALAERVEILTGDIVAPPAVISMRSFDQVFLNPPFVRPEDGNRPPDPGRARAMSGDPGGPGLDEWLAVALRRLRPRGRLTLIHRADRLDTLLAALAGAVGMLTVCPLWPMAGRPAKRVLVSGRRGITGGLTLSPGLVLHQADGSPSPALEAIARQGAGLDLATGTVSGDGDSVWRDMTGST